MLRYCCKKYGQMSPRHLMPEQMSPWQFASVKEGPRNLPLEFGQNLRYGGGGGGGGGKVIFT